MTTPRIEESGDISDVCLKLGKAVDGKPFINIIEWGAVLREAKANWEAEAHQAGIDEAVEIVENAKEVFLPTTEERRRDIKQGQNEKCQEIIKALQGNK